MYSNPIKIRISTLTLYLIDEDCRFFRVLKENNQINRNEYLNKLINSIYIYFSYKRKSIKNHIIDKILGNVNVDKLADTLITDILFDYDFNSRLDKEIWIRPNKAYSSFFDDLINFEIGRLGISLSTYLRSLINYYIVLPMYKKQYIYYINEITTINLAIANSCLISYSFCKRRIRVFPYNIYTNIKDNQRLHIVAYNPATNEVVSIKIESLYNLCIIGEEFYPTPAIRKSIEEFSLNINL